MMKTEVNITGILLSLILFIGFNAARAQESNYPEKLKSSLVTCVDSTLIDTNMLCSTLWDPVCGCDGVTYGNECEALNYGGVTQFTAGACIICPTIMHTILPKWDFCSWAFEIEGGAESSTIEWSFGDGTVENGSYWISHSYSSTGNGIYNVTAFYTDFYCPEGVELSVEIEVWGCDIISCINEAQIDSTYACTDIYDPVCGCNDVTYSNWCSAYYYSGITSWVSGECTINVDDIDNDTDWSVYPVPSSGEIRVRGLPEGVWPYKIYDSYGREVENGEALNNESLLLGGLPEGCYTLQILGIHSSAKRVLINR